MVNKVAPEPSLFLNTAAGLPLPELLTTKDFNLVLPALKVPVLVTVFAVIGLAIVASYYSTLLLAIA
jgi:hypothetical protein